MSDLNAKEMAAVFIGYTSRGNFDAVTLDDLEKWFEIDTDAAMEVMYQIGAATLSIHFGDCECDDGDEDVFDVDAYVDDEDDYTDDGELWDLITVGDPDPSSLLGDDYDCCLARLAAWSCTRTEGHSGQHIAGDGDEVCAVWK